MATRSWVRVALFCMAGLGAAVLASDAQESEKPPENLTDPPETISANPSPETKEERQALALLQSARRRLEAQRQPRTENGLAQPPQILLDRFPTSLVVPDASKNYTGHVAGLNSGSTSRMPQIGKEMFDQPGEGYPQSFQFSDRVLRVIRNNPERFQVSPDGKIHVFRDPSDGLLKPRTQTAPPPIIPPKPEVNIDAPPGQEPPDNKN